MMAGMNCNMGVSPANAGMQAGAGGAQSQAALMKQISESGFAMDDVLLFLDTHPDNMEALQYYRNAVAMRQNAIAAYERQFGPLFVDSVTGNSWNWVTENWPWEGGC